MRRLTGARDRWRHRTEKFKLSTDPQLVEKVRDIVGLYLNPPEHVLLLRVDEKSQVQALDRTQPILPLRPDLAEQRTSDYQRHGTTSLFAALDIATGKVIGECHQRHRHLEFLKFMERVEKTIPADAETRDARIAAVALAETRAHRVERLLHRRGRGEKHCRAPGPCTGCRLKGGDLPSNGTPDDPP